MGLNEDILRSQDALLRSIPLCPICDNKLATYTDLQDGHLLLEEGKECLRGCKMYHYQYAYGNSREAIWMPGFINEVVLGWNSSDKEYDEAARRLDRATKWFRFYWRTGLWRPIWVIGKIKQTIENFLILLILRFSKR